MICEKPAALKPAKLRNYREFSRTRHLLYVVNLMQRYNPLDDVVKTIVKEKIMGNFLHGFFENYASDEALGEDHWFWDKLKSGGIVIEHIVHFFDMFSGWLGKGEVFNALQLQRKEIRKEWIDRVQARVLYQDGIVNFYHGFDQPKILDRQEIRLQFEKGEVTLYEWVPVKMKLHVLFENDQLKKLHHLMGECSIMHHSDISTNKNVKGRFTDIHFEEHITMEYGDVLN